MFQQRLLLLFAFCIHGQENFLKAIKTENGVLKSPTVTVKQIRESWPCDETTLCQKDKCANHEPVLVSAQESILNLS